MVGEKYKGETEAEYQSVSVHAGQQRASGQEGTCRVCKDEVSRK